MPRYEGPIIDAHHHLWEPSKGNHNWLLEPGREKLAQDITPEAYADALEDFPIVGSVVVEGLANDAQQEARQVAEWREQTGGHIATGFVAHCPLDDPCIRKTIAELRSTCPALVGIRDIVAHAHGWPSFARSADLLKSEDFRAGLQVLARESLVFDLMLEPAQLADAYACLKTIPDLNVAIEHAGSPRDQSPSGLEGWRRGMTMLATLPKTVVKVSALQVHDPNWTVERLRRVFDPLTEMFGPDRMMMGTDFPGHDLACPSPEVLDAFLDLTEDWDAQEQAAFFQDTARRTYGLSW